MVGGGLGVGGEGRGGAGRSLKREETDRRKKKREKMMEEKKRGINRHRQVERQRQMKGSDSEERANDKFRQPDRDKEPFQACEPRGPLHLSLTYTLPIFNFNSHNFNFVKFKTHGVRLKSRRKESIIRRKLGLKVLQWLWSYSCQNPIPSADRSSSGRIQR